MSKAFICRIADVDEAVAANTRDPADRAADRAQVEDLKKKLSLLVSALNSVERARQLVYTGTNDPGCGCVGDLIRKEISTIKSELIRRARP